MSAEKNKETIRYWVAEAWNKGNLDIADSMYSPDYVYHDSLGIDLGTGPEAIKRLVGTYRNALPDMRFIIDDMVAEGDKVSWRWTATGTQMGALMSIPPTGKKATITGQLISRFKDGKWAEDYCNWDTLGMLQQLGVVPAMA